MSNYQTHHHFASATAVDFELYVRPGFENLKFNGNAGFLQNPTFFILKFMALMVDSVNINTDINDVSQTHVDDEGQPLSADVDI